MDRRPDDSPGRTLTRRSVLAAGVGLIAAGCGSVTRQALGSVPALPTASTSRTPPPAPSTTDLPPPPPDTSLAPPTTVAEDGTTLTSVPVLAVPARTAPAFYVKDLVPNPPSNAVALTIDDGPDPRYTPAVLQILAQYGVQASFSVIGRYARSFPSLLQDIVDQGHSLTNHSMNHPQPFHTLPQSKMRDEVVGCLEAIYDATGTPPTTFRSPGGDWSPAMFELLAELGMNPIDWDVDPRDWSKPGTTYIVSRLLAARPGDILLCHDGGGDRSETVTALSTVLPSLQARGLQFVLV